MEADTEYKKAFALGQSTAYSDIDYVIRLFNGQIDDENKKNYEEERAKLLEPLNQ